MFNSAIFCFSKTGRVSLLDNGGAGETALLLWGIDGSLVILGPRPEPPKFSKVFCDLLAAQMSCFGLIGLGEPLLIPTLIGFCGAVRDWEVGIGGNRLLWFKVT